MPKLSSKELFLACLSNPSVVRSRLQNGIDVDSSGRVIVDAPASKVPNSRPVRTHSGRSTSLTDSLHSSRSSFEHEEAVRIIAHSPRKNSSQQQEAVAESAICPDNSRLLSPSKAFHKSNSVADLKSSPQRALGQGRQNSLRSIKKDSPPQTPFEEKPFSRSPHVILKSSRSPRKARQGVGSVLSTHNPQTPSPPKSIHRRKSSALPSKMDSILDSVLMVPFDFEDASLSSVTSSDASSADKQRKSRQSIRSPSKSLNRSGHAEDRWSVSRCVRQSLDDDDDDDVSIEIDVAPPRSPRRSFTRKSSQSIIKAMSQSLSNLHYTAPSTLLDAPTQGYPTEMPTDYPPQVTSGASSRKPPSRRRSTSATNLNPMASTLPQKTLPSVSLADSRWDSSRSLLDSPPQVPAAEDEDESIDSSVTSGMNESPQGTSPEAAPVSPRSQQYIIAGQGLSALALKTVEPNPSSTASSQGIPTKFPTDYPPQAVTAVPRSPRKCLNEKARSVSVHCLFKNPGVSNQTVSRSASAAQLSPMASALPERTLPTANLSDSRWDSSRSLLDSPPKTPTDEYKPIVSSPEEARLSPRSQQKLFARLILSTLAQKTSEDHPPSVLSPPPASVAETKALPPMTCRASLAEARWDSSRSLNDCPRKPHTEVDESNDSSPNIVDLAPRSPRKTPQATAPTKASSQPAPVADTKALPPMTVCRASLAEARWDSSRSLNDAPPKLPTDAVGFNDSSPNVVDIAPRSPRKTPQATVPAKASSQPAPVAETKALPPTTVRRTSLAKVADTKALPAMTVHRPSIATDAKTKGLPSMTVRRPSLTTVADTKALPPMTLCRASLSEARWDSSRSLNDCPPKPPTEVDESNDCSPNVVDLAPRSPRKTSEAKALFKASLQLASAGSDTKAIPPMTVCGASLSEARWDSSRSLNDCPPKPSTEEEPPNDSLPNVEDKVPRSPRKTPQAKAPSKASIKPMTPRSSRKTMSEKAASARSLTTSGMSTTKAPSRTLPRAASVINRKAPPSTLAETRWDSARSLTDKAPKTPKSPRKKKQKDSHLRALLGLNKSIVPPAAPADKAMSASTHTMSRKGESSVAGKSKNRACPRRQFSMLKSASASSIQKNDEHTLKNVLDEYAKIIDDFKKAVPSSTNLK